MTVTVYSKPMCPGCDQTKRALTERGIEYNEIDISQDGVARNLVLEWGYRQVPVVQTASETWSGFNIEKIKAIAQ